MNKKIWWILIVVVILVLGMWLYFIGLKSSKKVSGKKAGKRPEIFQKKEVERVIRPEKKVIIPSDYEPISPEVEGIEDFAEERKREAQRKDRGIPTG